MTQDAPAEYHYLLRYSKTGPARYLSLHDVRRAWERSTRRAGLPLAYSRGFSPKPRLTFGPPLAVGAEGLDECMVLSLREALDPSTVHERLSATAVDGLSMGDIQTVARRKFTTVWASYDVQLEDPPSDLNNRVDGLLAAETFVIERKDRDGPRARPRDIRAGVLALQRVSGGVLTARLSLRDGTIVTPRDLAAALDLEVRHSIRTKIAIELPE